MEEVRKIAAEFFIIIVKEIEFRVLFIVIFFLLMRE